MFIQHREHVSIGKKKKKTSFQTSINCAEVPEVSEETDLHSILQLRPFMIFE